jgi:mannose-6-phosphate isomerase
VSLDPIVLRGVLHETIWGGQELSAVLGKKLPPGAKIGESWETAVDAVAVNQPYDGRTLGAITEELGERLYGSRARAIFGERFPLLIKFLDAHAWLSVQVHPDDAYAAAHENGKLGKTEAWRILATEGNAQIMHGFVRATNRDEVAQAVRDNTLEQFVYHMPVQPGDIVLNLAGTLHATGAGIVLYEIQEYSDVTYRLYDYGRKDANGQPRQLHVEQALDVLDYAPLAQHRQRPVAVGAHDQTGMNDQHEQLLVVDSHFALMEVALADGHTLRRTTDGTSCQIVSVIAGAVELSWGAVNAPHGISLGSGETVVLPAEPGTFHFTPDEEADDTVPRLLVAWVPDLNDPAVQAWRVAQG